MSTPRIHDTPPLRFAAIVLWSGFLGAICLLLGWLALAAPIDADLGQLSRFFFVAWSLALVPAACAALLMSPPAHGH
jgi:hypothetical protein